MLKYLRKKQFLQKFTVRFIGTVVLTLAGMGVSVLTARGLGPAGKGNYTLLYSAITFSIAILGLKLGFAQAYYKRRLSFGTLAGSTYLLSIASGIVAMAVSWVVVQVFADRIFGDVPFSLVMVMLVMVPVLLLAINLRSLLDANYSILEGTIVQASRPVLFLPVFGLFVLLGNGTIEYAVVAIVASISGMMLLGMYFTARLKGEDPVSCNWQASKSLLAFGASSHFGGMFTELQNRFDIFLVAYFMSPRAVGLYSVALALAEIMWKLPKLAASILLPRLAREQEQRRSIEITARLNRVIFALMVPVVIVFGLCVNWVIRLLFGTDFAGAADATLLLLPGLLFQSLYSITHNDMIMRGQAARFSVSVFLGLVVMITGDILLIPGYGIEGAALASSIGWAVTGSYVFVNVVRNNSLPVARFFDARPELNFLMAAWRNRGSA